MTSLELYNVATLYCVAFLLTIIHCLRQKRQNVATGALNVQAEPGVAARQVLHSEVSRQVAYDSVCQQLSPGDIQGLRLTFLALVIVAEKSGSTTHDNNPEVIGYCNCRARNDTLIPL